MSDFPENSPLAQPLPLDPTRRIERYARDLAWGALNGLWDAAPISLPPPGFNRALDPNFRAYLKQVWENQSPRTDLMVALGYMTISVRVDGSTDYLLTPAAFALLREPAEPPRVFISYRRRESSAFGLLVIARLKLVGVSNPFIDFQLEPGVEWSRQLENIVRGCRYFVMLIAPSTLASGHVQQELAWALDSPECTIIPVTHNGFQRDESFPAELSVRQIIEVHRESAEDYELAIIKLLNLLGYTP